LDEIKLEEVTLKSMAKKTGGLLQDMFKFVVVGAQQFAKDVDKTVKDGQKLIEDAKTKAVELANNVKEKAQELIKVADEEAKKFMKVAKDVYDKAASVAQQVAQTAVNFVAENAELLKTLNAVGGTVAGSLAAFLPQAANFIPGWCVVLLLPPISFSFEALTPFFTAKLGAESSSVL
jgi:ElaB/YqjD/DUF883 family membrane-anchored ribosome-binding protein